MRRDQLYVDDIIDAANAITRFINEVDNVSFMESDLVQSAVLLKLIVIGEACARLSSKFRAQHRDIPWKEVIGFRKLAVHAYFSMDRSIVWTAAESDVPTLRQLIIKARTDAFDKKNE